MKKVRRFTHKGHHVKIEVNYPIADFGAGEDTAPSVSAVGEIEITAVGDTGDTITANVDEGEGASPIGTYVQLEDDTEADIASGLSADINSGTETHGYTSTVTEGVISVIAPLSGGASANAYTLTAPVVGTMTAGITAFSGGVDGTVADVYKVELVAMIGQIQFERVFDSQAVVTTRIGTIEEAIKQTIDTFVVQQEVEVSIFTPMLEEAGYVEE